MEKFTVLLVDDVSENIHSLKLIIEDSFDINILSALSANEGMEILMKSSVDLILSDIQMPDIDGFQFAEYLKSVDATKDIPIIFITGIYDKDDYQKRGFDLGAVEYISKPIDDTLLSAKLKVYIDLFEGKKTSEAEINKKDQLLIHQSKMATMGEMIGVIAHQLKQPLNNMSLYCGDVKDSYKYDEIDDEFVEEFHKNTKEQIAFMTETINGFMNFFNPKKEKRLFTVKDALEKTVKLLDKQLETSNVVLNSQVGEETVYGVETELEQVFLNLITNAKEAFIERSIDNRNINITSMTKDRYSIVIVEDTAGGIKEESLEKIFDPYYTTKEYGTGTGLYMVKLVVKTSFKGDLKIQNTGQGAKFIIVVPNNKPS
ncbi:sensor histidine kinase [Poseidonibacter lekithochrous]|uniref:sensor histidine kinase n=1 Tax=Poseidonibacter lekithochrous TaxID=1904463 RepID=UPI0008FC921E|nr:hybrid sensor histidine kinase/response regulator [Poseidonibacter lekithochrous]QKJ22980.1 two-component system sensor histidine kinase/response regulator fusion protein [Poseidonibacter lekithochrous]